jgi:hypothetical protein
MDYNQSKKHITNLKSFAEIVSVFAIVLVSFGWLKIVAKDCTAYTHKISLC